tara:strand:- start:199 stop:366 length:168 start_codon:yes stop_codon:yes gene_type:complete
MWQGGFSHRNPPCRTTWVRPLCLALFIFLKELFANKYLHDIKQEDDKNREKTKHE